MARRFADRFADVEKRREVHDRKDIMPPQRASHGGDVGDVAFDELAVPDGFAMTGHQVVEHHDPMTGPVERLGGVAADVPGAPGDENAAALSVQWRNT